MDHKGETTGHRSVLERAFGWLRKPEHFLTFYLFLAVPTVWVAWNSTTTDHKVEAGNSVLEKLYDVVQDAVYKLDRLIEVGERIVIALNGSTTSTPGALNMTPGKNNLEKVPKSSNQIDSTCECTVDLDWDAASAKEVRSRKAAKLAVSPSSATQAAPTNSCDHCLPDEFDLDGNWTKNVEALKDRRAHEPAKPTQAASATPPPCHCVVDSFDPAFHGFDSLTSAGWSKPKSDLRGTATSNHKSRPTRFANWVASGKSDVQFSRNYNLDF